MAYDDIESNNNNNNNNRGHHNSHSCNSSVVLQLDESRVANKSSNNNNGCIFSGKCNDDDDNGVVSVTGDGASSATTRNSSPAADTTITTAAARQNQHQRLSMKFVTIMLYSSILSLLIYITCPLVMTNVTVASNPSDLLKPNHPSATEITIQRVITIHRWTLYYFQSNRAERKIYFSPLVMIKTFLPPVILFVLVRCIWKQTRRINGHNLSSSSLGVVSSPTARPSSVTKKEARAEPTIVVRETQEMQTESTISMKRRKRQMISLLLSRITCFCFYRYIIRYSIWVAPTSSVRATLNLCTTLDKNYIPPIFINDIPIDSTARWKYIYKKLPWRQDVNPNSYYLWEMQSLIQEGQQQDYNYSKQQGTELFELCRSSYRIDRYHKTFLCLFIVYCSLILSIWTDQLLLWLACGTNSTLLSVTRPQAHCSIYVYTSSIVTILIGCVCHLMGAAFPSPEETTEDLGECLLTILTLLNFAVLWGILCPVHQLSTINFGSNFYLFLSLMFDRGFHKDNKNIVVARCKEDGRVLQFVTKELQGDKDVVLAACKSTLNGGGTALKHCNPRLLKDRDVLRTACQVDGLVLAYNEIKEWVCNDREIVLVACQQNGLALQFASKSLRSDLDIVLVAVKTNPEALKFALGGLNQHRDCLIAAGIWDNDFRSADIERGKKKKIVLSTKFALSEDCTSIATQFTVMLKQHQYIKDNDFVVYSPNAYDKSTCDPLWTRKEWPCRGTYHTCCMEEESYKTGTPQHGSCWRYSFRYQLQDAKETNGFMIQLVELHQARGRSDSGFNYNETDDKDCASDDEDFRLGKGQEIETEMANSVGTKVFRVYQPYLPSEMNEIKQGHIDKVVFYIQQWYEEQNGQQQDNSFADCFTKEDQPIRRSMGETDACQIRCWGDPYNRYDPVIKFTHFTPYI